MPQMYDEIENIYIPVFLSFCLVTAEFHAIVKSFSYILHLFLTQYKMIMHLANLNNAFPNN